MTQRTTFQRILLALSLASVGALLLADSAQQCRKDADEVVFAVAGSCGPAGTVVARGSPNDCGYLLADAGELNLPVILNLEGSVDKDDVSSARSGRFSLNGEIRRPGVLAADAGCTAITDGGTSDAGCADGGPTPAQLGATVRVTCTRTGTEESGAVLLECRDYSGGRQSDAGYDVICGVKMTPTP